MTKLRNNLIISMLVIGTVALSGCFYDKWYDNYPIAYGEGIVWICENDDLEFYGYFETAHVQYGHYGKGEFTYNDSTAHFQLMFEQNTVSLVYCDGYEFVAYCAGEAEFSEPCMCITVSQVADDRFSALLGSKLIFYKTGYKVDDITQYEWIYETEELSANFSVVEDSVEGLEIWGEFNYIGIIEKFKLSMTSSSSADFLYRSGLSYESYFDADVDYDNDCMIITICNVYDERFAGLAGERIIFQRRNKENIS